MSMRARDPQDYSQGQDKLGTMGGTHKDQMNQMFDTRGKETENYQKNLLDSLENNKKKYDKQLYVDWVIKIYQRCALDCIQPPDDENPSGLKKYEKLCATNCIRKYDKAYKLYAKTENVIFNSYMETTSVDPELFYSQMNEMTPAQVKIEEMKQ